MLRDLTGDLSNARARHVVSSLIQGGSIKRALVQGTLQSFGVKFPDVNVCWIQLGTHHFKRGVRTTPAQKNHIESND